MTIINYYEIYGISQTDELERIQWIVNQKITDEENDPFGEGHSDRMYILNLAKEAFATIENKEKYDKELADSQKKRDPDGERKASLDKWYADAKKYFGNQQYDLAKTAIDHAMQFTTPETVDSVFYDTAARIYYKLKLYSQALDLENQSIVLSPNEPNGYYLKTEILHSYIFEKNLGDDMMQDIWKQLKNNCNLTIDKVITQGRGHGQASKCYELLAAMHYVPASGIPDPKLGAHDGEDRFPVTGDDNALAEDYALSAVSIINAPNPDVCPIAKKILDDIAARRVKVAELEQVNANLRDVLKKENDELVSLESKIKGATTYGSTSFGGEVWIVVIAAIIGLICLGCAAKGAGLFFIIIAVGVLAIKGGIITKNNNIRDTLSAISQINNNIAGTKYQIRNNDNIISQQSAGLAPRPVVKNSAERRMLSNSHSHQLRLV